MVEVSVPAQCTRPNGSRSKWPNRMRIPGRRCAIEQPRVHCSSDHAVSTKATGSSARRPRRAASALSTALRRSTGSSFCTRAATGPNVNDAITPGVPVAGDESIVVSETEPGSDVWPLKPAARQNGSS